MVNRLKNTIWLAAAAAMLIAGGCAEVGMPDVGNLARGPAPGVLEVTSDYSARAIRAAGGLEAWADARGMEFDCVVTFYQADGTFYLTEQIYQVFPWSNSMRILGQEPAGGYGWQLTDGRLEVLQGQAQYDGLGVGVDQACVAEAVLNIITAPARLLDSSSEFVIAGRPIRVLGQEYHSLKRTAKADVKGAGALRDASFYQNRSSSRVDMVVLSCGGGDTVLVVRGYDYRLVSKGGVMVPGRIEVYKADATGRVQNRMIEITVK